MKFRINDVSKIKPNIKTLLYTLIILVVIVYMFTIYRFIRVREDKLNEETYEGTVFEYIAKLLTNPNQKEELSYGWYQQQLQLENKLGNVKFKDPVMTRFGFQETETTSENWFYYFRVFKPKEQCERQSSCEIYPQQTAQQVIEEQGINLDAILHHYSYREPFHFEPFQQQQQHVAKLHSLLIQEQQQYSYFSILNRTLLSKRLSNRVDSIYGEEMWRRGMRRLTLFMNSEAKMDENIKPLIQIENDLESMTRFSSSTADISVCFQKSCSLWVNYLYYPIEFVKNHALFGTKPKTPNKGICSFISNCDLGNVAQQRLDLLTKLSKYLPIRQYGACGNNVKEGAATSGGGGGGGGTI